MTTTEQSIFEQTVNPIVQASIAFGGVVIVTLGSKLVKLTGLLHVADRFPWVAAASFMLVFALFNSVFSLTSENILKYWGRSIYSFLGLAFASGVIAYLFSSLSIDEAGSYRWIYLVLTIGYLVFLGMMAFMRRIVDFAQKEEWNHPRIRQKKNNKSSR
jgi:drug/metabolite transporter (DMT)-like permease